MRHLMPSKAFENVPRFRYYLMISAALVLLIAAAGCGNDSRRYPGPADAAPADAGNDATESGDTDPVDEGDSDRDVETSLDVQPDIAPDDVQSETISGDVVTPPVDAWDAGRDTSFDDPDAAPGTELATLVEYCTPLSFEPDRAPLVGDSSIWTLRLSTQCGYRAGRLSLKLTHCDALGDPRTAITLISGIDGLAQSLDEPEDVSQVSVFVVRPGTFDCELVLEVGTRSLPYQRTMVAVPVRIDVQDISGGFVSMCAPPGGAFRTDTNLGATEPALVRCAVFDPEGSLQSEGWEPQVWSLLFNGDGIRPPEWSAAPPWIEIPFTAFGWETGFVVGAEHPESGLRALPAIVHPPL